MKNILVLFIFLAAAVSECFSQLNILDSSRDKRWHIVWTYGVWPPWGVKRYETTVLKLGEQVVLKDSTYTKILATKDSLFSSWDTIGYMRESNRQVFYNPISRDSDFLLYDFSIAESTIIALDNPFYKGRHPFQFVVTKIDSLDIGIERRKSILLNGSELWIEGVGSLKGLIYSGLVIDGSKVELSCYSENGVVLYQNPEYSACFCTTGIDNPDSKRGTLTATNGFIRIRNNRDALFQLFDLTGKRLLSRLIGTDDYIIDLSMLKKGVYLYRIGNLNTGGKVVLQ